MLVVYMEAGSNGLNAVMVQKLCRSAGILRCNERYFVFEDAEGTKSDVFEVADRSGDEIQGTSRFGW